jgi:superfamily II DNA or RNA helicase
MHIVDEAHHAVAGTWETVLNSVPGRILGVTATPARLDGKGLGHLFDDILFGPSMADLIGMGYLARPRTFRPSQPNMKGMKKSGGDYNRGQAEQVMDQKHVTGDAVEHYSKIMQGAPTLVFCTTNRHAEHVREQYSAAGFRAARMDQDTPMAERRQMLHDLAQGRINILTSCEVISEGTDVPQCYGSQLLRPTDSLVLYLQQCGRALRPKPNGEDAIILDHAGNSHRHGLPEADRKWSLDKGVEETKEGTGGIRTCDQCFAVMPSAQKVCPVCGAEKQTAKTRIMPRQRAGELLEAEGIQVGPRQDPATMPLKELTKKAQSLDQLKAIEKVRGYRPGWAERFQEGREKTKSRVQQYKNREAGYWRFGTGERPW